MNFTYICTDCKDDETRYETNVYKHFKQHVLSDHKNSTIELKYKYNCESRTTDGNPCGYKTDDKSKYDRHMSQTKLHGNEPTLQCTLCNQVLYMDHHLSDHMRTHNK